MIVIFHTPDKETKKVATSFLKLQDYKYSTKCFKIRTDEGIDKQFIFKVETEESEENSVIKLCKTRNFSFSFLRNLKLPSKQQLTAGVK